MKNSRINVSSLIVTTMSVCACIFFLDSQALAQVSAAVAQSQATESRQHATAKRTPLVEMLNRILGAEAADAPARAKTFARGYDVLFFATSANRREYQQMYKSREARASGAEVTVASSMPRETFCALLSKYLSSH